MISYYLNKHTIYNNKIKRVVTHKVKKIEIY